MFFKLFNLSTSYEVQHFDLVGNKNRNGSYNGLLGSVMQVIYYVITCVIML